VSASAGGARAAHTEASGGGSPLLQGPAARFVREGLGCQCPEEVFERLRAVRDPDVGGLRALWRIEVGGRLLVYVLELGDARDLERLVPAARAERERGGFQRLRVAVVDEDAGAVSRLEAAWGRVAEDDPRAHLHVVSRAEVNRLCECC